MTTLHRPHQRRRPPNAWPAPGLRPGDRARPASGWTLGTVLLLAAVAGWCVAALLGYAGWVLVHGLRDASPWGGSP